MRENKRLNGMASATNFYIPFLRFLVQSSSPLMYTTSAWFLVTCLVPGRAGWCVWVQRAFDKGNCQIALPRMFRFVHLLLPALSCHTHLSLEWSPRCPFLTCCEKEDLEGSQIVSGALKEGKEPLRNCRPGCTPGERGAAVRNAKFHGPAGSSRHPAQEQLGLDGFPAIVHWCCASRKWWMRHSGPELWLGITQPSLSSAREVLSAS